MLVCSQDEKPELLKYDKVLVATGGSPRKLFVPGSDLQNIFTLRTPEDAQRISALAKKGQKMIVVGGSFIGMEVASSLAKKGCEVAVIAMETVPFERVLGKKVGASFARKLQKEGVEWCLEVLFSSSSSFQTFHHRVPRAEVWHFPGPPLPRE